MIGKIITDKDGFPLDNAGGKLSQSQYQPPKLVRELFAKVQTDYQTNWALHHKPLDEFDGYSLLERARLDQQTFAVFVGAAYVAKHKRWRWKGRKNTARNKLIGILAHMIAGMLYPFVYAKNESNEEDKMTARVMRILVEDKLKKAKYELNFLFMVLSALVNPAVFVDVSYVVAMQRIKTKLKSGKYVVEEVIDELLSGLMLNVAPIDEVLLGDLYTGSIQRQPNIIRVRRISYDQARSEYSGKHFDKNGKDLFDYVQAGKTRIVLAGQDNQTLFDIEWTEADANFVQVINAKYRGEDLEVEFVGGVFMGDEEDPYLTSRFKHRRMVLVNGEWKTIPIYSIAKSYFEPIDPTGRFAYGKSGAFKEYWDDASQNVMHRLAHDGTYLDVMKPIFISGAANVNGIVMAPGSVTGMPANATVTPYQLGPNLAAAINMMNIQKDDMAESTQDKIMSGGADAGVTAYATSKAEQNARIFLGVFGAMMADLISQVGDLVVDIVVQHETVGEVDLTVPGTLGMKYKTILTKGKEKGKDVTHKIVFTDKYFGKDISKERKEEIEWELYNKAGGATSDQRIYEVNPYNFARQTYSMYVDPDKIIRKSMGLDRQEKLLAFNIMTDPRVIPFTDQKAVVDDFAIEEYGGDDPDRYKKKGNQMDLLGSVMGNNTGTSSPPVKMPSAQPSGVVSSPTSQLTM